MRYVNRALEPISRAEHAKLSADKRYAIVASHKSLGDLIETTWVGIVSELEATPRPFLVEYKRQVKDKKTGEQVWKPMAQQWYESEEEALRNHKRIADELGMAI